MIIFYVPCKDKKEAKTIAKELLKERIIACANILPSESIYEFEGKIREETEAILLIKTIDIWEEEVKDIIKQHHSYDIPAIVRLTARVNEEYLSWMEEVIKQP